MAGAISTFSKVSDELVVRKMAGLGQSIHACPGFSEDFAISYSSMMSLGMAHSKGIHMYSYSSGELNGVFK